MASSPTSRSLAKLREEGYQAEVVERWISFAGKRGIRKDLFGFIDILAVGHGETVAVQTTSASNMAARIRKIAESDQVPECRKANWRILVHGWRKDSKGKWICRVEDVS